MRGQHFKQLPGNPFLSTAVLICCQQTGVHSLLMCRMDGMEEEFGLEWVVKTEWIRVLVADAGLIKINFHNQYIFKVINRTPSNVVVLGATARFRQQNSLL